MFTGIIQSVALVKSHGVKQGSLFLTIEKPRGWRLKPGDSVATNGACLTVKQVHQREYVTELMPETLCVTSFGKTVPKAVNVERPLTLRSLVAGHLVLGHVDAVGKVKAIQRQRDSRQFTFIFPKKFSLLVVPKGSIAIDGISLTVVDCGSGWCSVALVPYTLEHTTLGQKLVGELVNIEFDIIGKYLLNL